MPRRRTLNWKVIAFKPSSSTHKHSLQANSAKKQGKNQGGPTSSKAIFKSPPLYSQEGASMQLPSNSEFFFTQTPNCLHPPQTNASKKPGRNQGGPTSSEAIFKNSPLFSQEGASRQLPSNSEFSFTQAPTMGQLPASQVLLHTSTHHRKPGKNQGGPTSSKAMFKTPPLYSQEGASRQLPSNSEFFFFTQAALKVDGSP